MGENQIIKNLEILSETLEKLQGKVNIPYSDEFLDDVNTELRKREEQLNN